MKNAITQGAMTVRLIRGIDEAKGQLYLRLLAASQIAISTIAICIELTLMGRIWRCFSLSLPNTARSFLRTSSTLLIPIPPPLTLTISVLHDTHTGKVIKEFQRANISQLLSIGWKPPKSFEVLAGNDKTPLYGLTYLLSNFDHNKQYPIIDDIYTGAHNFFTPKSFFTYGSQANVLPELGFIVIKMDGRGTSKRGRAFHEHAFKNLGNGVDDHVVALKRLATEFNFIDIDRIGIFGFSAGGYDTDYAMLKYPDFFKVGVSASGNHDFRVDKAGWNEMWMDFPVTPHWGAQSNLTIAHQLKGKLLLMHGELDPNVHPAATLQLASKLMQANKDFELMIYPNIGHVFDKHPYFVR
jgi:dipeptidyl aminopeptidase/acylaminoacyl peptidase